VLDALGSFCESVVSIFGKVKAKQMLAQLIAELKAEITRLNSNSESSTRTKYLALLNNILKTVA
jgi:hypothetical protein